MLDYISRCPVCDSVEKTEEMSFYDADFLCDLWRCGQCSVVYLSSQLPIEEMSKLEDSNTYYIGLDEDKELKACSEMIECFERYVDKGRLLEIGCSNGFLLKAAEMRGWEAAGVEICKTTAEYARTHFGLTVYNKELQNCPFQESTFDLVVLWHTLEHIKQPRALIREVSHVLREGGVIAIQVPSYSLTQSTTNEKVKQRILCKVHNSYFTADTLSYLLRSEGCEIFYVNEEKGDCSLTIFSRKRSSLCRAKSVRGEVDEQAEINRLNAPLEGTYANEGASWQSEKRQSDCTSYPQNQIRRDRLGEMRSKPHPAYLDEICKSTYRFLLSDAALVTMAEIMADEEILGSADAETLSLLATLIHTCQMTRVLQIGTWIGYSTVAFAGALAHSKKASNPMLVTVDPARLQLEKAKSYISRAGLTQYVQFIEGSSLDVKTQQRIHELGAYDLVFIDSQHDYATASVELKAYWPSVKEGGILAVHDAGRFAVQYDAQQEGGVFRAISEWINAERVEQYMLLTSPLWNPVGLLVAFKTPPGEQVFKTRSPARALPRTEGLVMESHGQTSETEVGATKHREKTQRAWQREAISVLQANAELRCQQCRGWKTKHAEPGMEVVAQASCPICGSSGQVRVYEGVLELKGIKKVDLVRCNSCGHHFYNPRPRSLLYADDVVETNVIPDKLRFGILLENGASVVLNENGARHFYQRVLDVLEPGMRILDVGCGIGDFVELTRRMGFDSVGVEPDPTLVKGAEGLFPEAKVTNSRIEDLDVAAFDLITFFDVCEHLLEPVSVLRAAVARLRPGGWLYAQSPNYECLHRALQGREWEMFYGDHFQHFTLDTFRRLMETAGLQIANIYTDGWLPHILEAIDPPARERMMGVWVREGMGRYGHTIYCYARKAIGAKTLTQASNVERTATKHRENSERPCQPQAISVLQVNAEAGSQQYRVYNVSEQMELADIPHRILNLSEIYANPEAATRQFKESTIIVFHRVAYDSLLDRLCREARGHGATLVYETDDLTLFPDLDRRWVDGLRYLSSDEMSLYYEGLERYRKMMILCDVGLFSTEFLARMATHLGKRSWVLRNALDSSFVEAAERAYKQKGEKKRANVVRLGFYSGTKTHDRDFREFGPTLLRLMEEDSRVELVIFGHLALPSEFYGFHDRVKRYPAGAKWQEVPEILAQFDINVAPLESRNPFCRAKSELKYFEPGILGIPTVATRIDAFEHAIRHGENGFLVSNGQELEDCLRKLINDEGLRRKIGEAARDDVLVRYTPAARSQELRKILVEIQETTSSPVIPRQ